MSGSSPPWHVHHVVVVTVLLFALVLVSSKVRKEMFLAQQQQQQQDAPMAIPPDPYTIDVKASEVSGKAMPGVLNNIGNDLLIRSIPSAQPCTIQGVLMPKTFERPSDAQLKLIPDTENACVINASYPGIVDACRDPNSLLYGSAVQRVQYIPSGKDDDSKNMQCMVVFKGDASATALRQYRLANNPEEQAEILRATNAELMRMSSLLQRDKDALNLAQAQAAKQQGDVESKLQETIRKLQAALADNTATIESVTRMRDTLQAQLVSKNAITNPETAAVIDALKKRAEDAEMKAANAAETSINYEKGLKIDVYDLIDDGGQFQAGAKRFTVYGPRLYTMNLIHFPNTSANWAGESWLDHRIFIEMSGFLEIPEDREYRFFMVTDDGATIRIAGETVLSSMRLQGYGMHTSEPIKLAKGRVPIETRWYENYGDKVFILCWDYPNGTIMPHKFGNYTAYVIPRKYYWYAKPKFQAKAPEPTVLHFPVFPESGEPPVFGPSVPSQASMINMQNEFGRTSSDRITTQAPILRSFASTFCNNGSMSVAFWINIERTDDKWRNILHVTTGMDARDGNRRPAYWIGPKTGRLHLCSDTTASINETYTTTHNIPLNTWTLVVVTYTGRNATCYLYTRESKKVESWAWSGTPLQAQSNASVYAASYFPWYSMPSNYNILALRFYNTVLSKQDVAMIYNKDMYYQ
jgi:Concanavalin A-like lectin/glucanases superfamily